MVVVVVVVAVVVVVVVAATARTFWKFKRWLASRLRAPTFAARGPDQAHFPQRLRVLSTAEPCATARLEDV